MEDIKKTKWSKKEDEKLMKMFRNDKTYGEIGAKLGRSYASVTQRVHKLRNAGKILSHESIKKHVRVTTVKPKYVEVAEKVLKQTKKEKPSGFYKAVKKTDTMPLKLDKILADGQSALKHMTRLVLYAEMLEKQNAALKTRLAKIEKAIRD
jgi:DNA-binding Lrp family transcriptional regulator